MGSVLRFGTEEVKVKNEFDGKGRVVIRESPTVAFGNTPEVPVFWEGWCWAERLNKWTAEETLIEKPGWLDSGAWKRADVLATAWNERFRWYNVSKWDAIKVIVLPRSDRIIMKVITRLARGKEKLVTGKPGETGKIEDARFTMTGPQRVFLSPNTTSEIEIPF